MELDSLSTLSRNGTTTSTTHPQVPQEPVINRDEHQEVLETERRRAHLLARFQHWWQNDEGLDVLEQNLRLRLTTTNDPAARRLLRVYPNFKSQPGGDLFKFLILFRRSRPDNLHVDYERLDLETSLPFTSCIDELRKILQQTTPSRLQICVLIGAIPNDIQTGDPSFVSKIFVSTETLHSIHESPLLAVLNVIESDWALSSEARNICRYGPSLPEYFPSVLPSQAKSKSLFPLEPSEWTIINIPWFKDVVEYTQDVAVYVWEPHLSPMQAIGASICISPSDLGDQQVLVVLKPSKARDQSFQNTLENFMSASPASVKHISGVEIEITSIVLSVYSLLVNDTILLVEQLNKLIHHLTHEGRRSPSVSKIHYSLYLAECQAHSYRAISVALDVLTTLPRIDSNVINWIEKTEKDLLYLQDRLQEVKSKLNGQQKAIKDALDLRQVRLSRLLAILAAIYLPFSFVSSFFGMNVSNPLWKTKPNLSSTAGPSTETQASMSYISYETSAPNRLRDVTSITDALSDDSLINSQTQMDALITAISTSGPHLFTLSTFVIVACTVTFMTIILPLMAGKIFRIMLQSVDRYKGHWRVLVFILSLAAIILTRIFIPSYFQFVYIIIFGVPQMIFAIFILYKTSCTHIRWIAYAGLLSTAIIYDSMGVGGGDILYGPFLGLTGVLPLFYLLVLGAATDVLVLMRTRNLRQNGSTKFVLPATFVTHQKKWIWVLIAVWLAVNVTLFFLPGTLMLYMAGYSVFFGLFGIGKIIKSTRAREGQYKWVIYLVAVIVSTLLDFFVAHGILLSTVPFLWLILFRLYQKDEVFVKRYFPNWAIFRKSQLHSVSRPAEQV